MHRSSYRYVGQQEFVDPAYLEVIGRSGVVRAFGQWPGTGLKACAELVDLPNDLSGSMPVQFNDRS